MFRFIENYIKNRRKDSEYNKYINQVSAGEIEQFLNSPAWKAVCDQIINDNLQKVFNNDDDHEIKDIRTINKIDKILTNRLSVLTKDKG